MAKRMFDSAIYGKIRFHVLDSISQNILHFVWLGNETNSAGLFRVNLRDLTQQAKLSSVEALEEKLQLLQQQGFIEYDRERELIYVKDLTVTNGYHTCDLKGNVSSILSALRASQGSPLLRNYYEDHKNFVGSKVFQHVFNQLKQEKLLSD